MSEIEIDEKRFPKSLYFVFLGNGYGYLPTRQGPDSSSGARREREDYVEYIRADVAGVSHSSSYDKTIEATYLYDQDPKRPQYLHYVNNPVMGVFVSDLISEQEYDSIKDKVEWDEAFYRLIPVTHYHILTKNGGKDALTLERVREFLKNIDDDDDLLPEDVKRLKRIAGGCERTPLNLKDLSPLQQLIRGSRNRYNRWFKARTERGGKS